ncbi:MAG: alkaline phosphatase family protein [Thermotogota bacterium]|nr:alkaline phosphatase family protein [Thermotogota bacterium]
MNLREAILSQYDKGLNDYWIPPLVACDGESRPGRIQDGDTVIFCCRRGEREVQLMESFVEKRFTAFPVRDFSRLCFVPLVEYHEKFSKIEPIVPPVRPERTLGEVLSGEGKKQLAVTESEKESHVTFFFNGRHSRLYPGQVAEIIPSWKDFKNHPEMKSAEIAKAVVKAMDRYDFIIINFPAGDVIGHLLEMDLKVKAAEEIDKALGAIYSQATSLGRTLIITADHGLMERGFSDEGTPSVSHTTAPVPFIVVNPRLGKGDIIRDGCSLVDVAPTVLSLMGMRKPEEMTGRSLLKRVPVSSGVVLVILDGWGEGSDDPSINPLKAASTPNLDFLKREFPFTRLKASEEYVGLPHGRSGNSETGHLTIGAGRLIEQDELRLMRVIERRFEDNPVLERVLNGVKGGASLHLIGMLSEASSHGNINEILSISKVAESKNIERIFSHLILDGRSAPPRSAVDLLEKYREELGKTEVVTAVGRGYALDRSKDYTGKTKPVYDALVEGKGECYYGL